MSDSYERIQDQAALEQQRLRAGLLLELEIDMSEDDKINAKFPSHLHVLIPKDHDETEFDGGNQWLGVLGAIKGEISAQGEKTKKDVSAVETKINGVEESLNKKIGAVDAKMDESNKKIAAVETKMDEILSILKSNLRT
jgi:hypothetical protein